MEKFDSTVAKFDVSTMDMSRDANSIEGSSMPKPFICPFYGLHPDPDDPSHFVECVFTL